MKPWIQSTRNGFEMSVDEIERIYAETVQGEQSIMVQKDMKQWALKEGMWPHSHYDNIKSGHADARGWTQEGFTGMEICE
ncbi:MAG TPA: hypothetical protein DCW83_13465 [Saprospirales bacterium]|mgnify:FL=1|jgi:hypothetical protein|nr:hypothetical protein [Saprospirales bacterium]